MEGKLTLVSVRAGSRHFVRFMYVKPDSDGRVRVDKVDMPGHGEIPRGKTIRIGG